MLKSKRLHHWGDSEQKHPRLHGCHIWNSKNFQLFFFCYFELQVYVLNPIENLRGYINNRPPLVIFMISVSAVAIAFLTIGYFFKIKEIKSPELTEVSGAHHHCSYSVV